MSKLGKQPKYKYKSPQMRQKTCPNCGKEFSYIWKVGQDRNFCSDKCRHTYNYQRTLIENTPRTCLNCGKPTYRRYYCSQKCAHTSHIIIDESGNKFVHCSKCKKLLPLTSEFFYHSSANKNIGFGTRCKFCCNKEQEKWRKTEKGKILRTENLKRNIETTRKYRKRTQPIRNALEKIRKKTDPIFALNCRMRILMYASLRKVKNGHKWQDLAGYSVNDLRSHIEKQFKGGMSWERFLAGEIHIDHKIPVSVFNFKKPEDIDFKRCWSLKNLQPLWAKDNISKHAKIQKPFQPSLQIGV
jgi:endogenous inhibitor of DNA gyrase (YacG/DUF329 family)